MLRQIHRRHSLPVFDNASTAKALQQQLTSADTKGYAYGVVPHPPAQGKFVTAACQPFAAQHTIPQHARMKQSWSAQLFQETVHVSSDQLLLLLGHRQQLLSTWAAAPGMAWLCLPGCTCWLWMSRFSGVTLTRSLVFFCCCCCSSTLLHLLTG